MKLTRCTYLVAVALISMIAASSSSVADSLQKIIEQKKISIGIKTDYVPWGMRDSKGEIVGMEIDLAKDFARRLGEKNGVSLTLELVPVVAANRLQFLQEGRIDVLMATMTDNAERRKLIGIVQPNWYSSGAAVFARKSSGIADWESLKGKTICGVQGAWFNKEFGTKNGAEMITFKGVPEVENALLNGRCVGWLFDDSAFIPRMLHEPDKWADFHIATSVIGDAPWGHAVRLEDLNAPLGQELSKAAIDWHKSGLIVALEAKWGIPRTAWVVDMFVKCNAGDPKCDSIRDPE